MNERLKLLRKILKISQDEFGSRLGVTGAAISRIESGGNKVTDQMVKAVCREFSVDYIWLTTGVGEMLVENDDDIMESIDRIMLGENEFHKNLFKALAKASDEDVEALARWIDLLSDARNGK